MRQIELLRFTIDALERLGISYAVVGSYASGAWGEPRMTRDIDIVINLAANQVESLCAVFPEDEFYVSRTAALDAMRRRGQFNVIHPRSGNKIDFMVVSEGGWAAAQLSRSRRIFFEENTAGIVAAPEDVILGKLVFYREGGSEKHLRDIAGILKVSGEIVDRSYVQRFAEKLDVVDIWQAVLERVDKR